MNTSDGKNVEKLGATTEALAQGHEKVQSDAEAGPVETDANDNVVSGQDTSDAQPVEASVEKTTTVTEESSSVVGRRNEDLEREVQGSPDDTGKSENDASSDS